jgi:uncharacterized membrane protein
MEMTDFGGMMGAMMGIMLLVPLLIVLSIGALIVWALRDRRVANESPEAPLTILQRRYARGDISTEEYERMRTTLARI